MGGDTNVQKSTSFNHNLEAPAVITWVDKYGLPYSEVSISSYNCGTREERVNLKTYTHLLQ